MFTRPATLWLNWASCAVSLQQRLCSLGRETRPRHSDSPDTFLYARLYHSEPRVLWMETKKSWMGTFPWSHDHDSCTMAFGNPLLYVWEKNTSKSLSHPELEPFQKFTIPLKNLQFHWKYVSLWEGFSEHCGLLVGVRSDQRCAAKLSAWWAAKRRLISNDRHGVISLWIIANKPSLFS